MSAASQSYRDHNTNSIPVFQYSADQFGLLGLLSVIRMNDPDLTSLALGIDLTTLGLNLNSTDNLHKTFGSPWSNEPAKGEPQCTVPECYYAKQPPVLHVSFPWHYNIFIELLARKHSDFVDGGGLSHHVNVIRCLSLVWWSLHTNLKSSISMHTWDSWNPIPSKPSSLAIVVQILISIHWSCSKGILRSSGWRLCFISFTGSHLSRFCFTWYNFDSVVHHELKVLFLYILQYAKRWGPVICSERVVRF